MFHLSISLVLCFSHIYIIERYRWYGVINNRRRERDKQEHKRILLPSPLSRRITQYFQRQIYLRYDVTRSRNERRDVFGKLLAKLKAMQYHRYRGKAADERQIHDVGGAVERLLVADESHCQISQKG